MTGTSPAFSHRSRFACAVAQLIIVLLAAACASSTQRGSPTAPAIPSIPAITPIGDRQDPSPTPKPSPTETPPSEVSPPTDTPADAAVQAVHTVEPGDTLLGLAKAYGVPMAAIQLENGMGSSTVVKTGQDLAIPSADAWSEASPYWVVHEVAPGETLTEIARDHDLDLEELLSVNGLDDADRITVGQRLILSLGSPAPPAAAPTAPATEPPTTEPTAAPTASSTAAPTTVPDETSLTTAVPASPAPAAEGQDPLPPADLASWPHEIARLINEVRAEHGMPPLEYNDTLERAAQAHANDCAQRGWGSHTGSDGSNIKARVLRAGYDGTGWAECWAHTQTPQKAIEVWMDETPPNDPHRRTLLSDWLTEIGVGVAHADWGHYIFADFGRP